jgi:hypothetical protein
MDLTIEDIKRDLENNDKFDYYYYLSDKTSAKNIVDWVKISEIQYETDQIDFTVNTKDVKNYGDLAKADKLYIYIKEVAKNENCKIDYSILRTPEMNETEKMKFKVFLDVNSIHDVEV